MKDSLLQIIQAVSVFIVLFFSTFLVFPYVTANRSFDTNSHVSGSFPIAILKDGRPGIVKWSEYAANPEAFSETLVRTASGEMYHLEGTEHFSISPAPDSSLELTLHEDDYTFWARYSIENGKVKPIAFRFTGAFVVFYCFLVGLIGTPVVILLWRKYLNRSVMGEA